MMSTKIAEIAERIRTLREIMEITVEEMAQITGMSVQEYQQLESGEYDFSFTFLFQCAERFGVDMIELLTGDQPKLSFYSIVRKGKGLPITRRKGFTYQHLAPTFKNKLAEPFMVTAPYREEEQDQPIHLSYHEGQEFDLVLKGRLKIVFENHVEYLNEGDAVYYDSGHGHGMIATNGEDCVFLAVVLKDHDGEEKK